VYSMRITAPATECTSWPDADVKTVTDAFAAIRRSPALSRQLAGEPVEFTAPLEREPIDMVVIEPLVEAVPGRPATSMATGLGAIGDRQALGAPGDLSFDQAEVAAGLTAGRFHAGEKKQTVEGRHAALPADERLTKLDGPSQGW
jgi:hypothetical protein